MIELEFTKKEIKNNDILIVPVFQNEVLSNVPKSVLDNIKNKIENKYFEGKLGEILNERMNNQAILLVGLGEKARITPELAKTAGAKLTASLQDVSTKQIGFSLNPQYLNANLSINVLEGMMLRNYLDARFKTGDDLETEKKKLFTNLTIIGDADTKFKKNINDINKIVNGIFLVRDLVSAPPVDMKPEDLAWEAEKISKDYSNVTYKSLNKKEIEKEGMGLLAAVNRGSSHDPRMIILQLNPEKKGKPIVLVGKGLTFDSGGYNLKPAAGIRYMHIDMAGGATVLGTIKALAELGTKKKVIGIVPATENMVSGDAYKPSDIIKSHAGLTVEIENTDAEGRLILADALSYSIKEFKPSLIIDLATLTGACMVALGERYSGIFSNRPEVIENLQQASKSSGEKVWPLPLDETFRNKMKSKVADLGNIGSLGRMAGASGAAAFLSYFIDDTPWAHIDIAGPTLQDKELEAWNPPSGMSGYGVRLLVSLIGDIIKKS